MPPREDELADSIARELALKKWTHVFFFANTILLIVSIALICLMASLESYWDFFYPFLQVYRDMHGMGVFFTGAMICVCTLYGYIICCLQKGRHFIWYGLTLLMVIILDSRIILSGLINQSIVQHYVGKSMDRGMEMYGNNSIYKKGFDNVQLGLMCCGIRNYTEWNTTLGYYPYSCCPWTGESNIVDNKCVSSEVMGFFKEPCFNKLLDVPEVGMALLYCIVSILISLKVLTMVLTYKLERMHKYL